jgi:hypothetical protein
MLVITILQKWQYNSIHTARNVNASTGIMYNKKSPITDINYLHTTDRFLE